MELLFYGAGTTPNERKLTIAYLEKQRVLCYIIEGNKKTCDLRS